MADWRDIPNESIEPDAPARSIDAFALRDNPIAIAEGAAGAPRIKNAAHQDGVIGAEKFQSGASERDWVLGRISGASAGALGTYAFAWLASIDVPPAFGATVSGGSLRPAGFTSASVVNTSSATTSFPSGADIVGSSGTNASNLSGTWRCMGEATRNSDASGNYPHTLWLRIA